MKISRLPRKSNLRSKIVHDRENCKKNKNKSHFTYPFFPNTIKPKFGPGSSLGRGRN